MGVELLHADRRTGRQTDRQTERERQSLIAI